MLLWLILACGPSPHAGDSDSTPFGDSGVTCQPQSDVCNGVDDDCDGVIDEDAVQTLWYFDQDHDDYGDPNVTLLACDQPEDYVATPDDCDDANREVNPGEAEICDGVDHDCDGEVMDDDATDRRIWHVDADGDGFGDADTTIEDCVAPSGYVGNDGDCDDSRSDVSPRAAEVCDDADTDEDCDGTADGGDTWAAGGQPWYPDADADGFGDAAASPTWACDAPEGFVADDNDCVDIDAAINPSATETCNGQDDDCDTLIDSDATFSSVWYVDADADGFGDSTISAIACSAPEGYTSDGTDCDDNNNLIYPGAEELQCEGSIDFNCDGTPGAGDADGDGVNACDDCDDADPLVQACPEP